ncbi:MAG TPA: aminotransferase class III-fold pyridoxal phosphate-dependent enzyme [Bacteroidetes bacterium]|nr:aminotransferase class III-fold pyridoxal phosphate-dependent enzyme [Bacteroidota bacterium]
MVKNKPNIGTEEIERFINLKYGLSVSCSELNGERDQNVLLTAGDGSEYVLKITNPCEDDEFIEAQNDVLKFLSERVSLCPVIVQDKMGNDIAEFVVSPDEKYRARLVTYFRGRPVGLLKNHPAEMITDLGMKLGRIDAALEGYYNKGFDRDFKWDLANFEKIAVKNIGLISDEELAVFIKNTLGEYREIVKPEAAELRRSVIHNDVNDYNIIVNPDTGLFEKKPEIEGFIDFGDMVYSYTVANVAVAIAYLMLGKDEPLRDAASVLSGYHKVFALRDKEIRVLFTMAKTRLALSICIAASQQRERPGDSYLAISQEPIKKIIPALGKIHPLFAETIFREACGMKPPGKISRLISTVENIGKDAYPLLGEHMTDKNCLVLNLGVNGSLVESDPLMNTAGRLGVRIEEELKRHRRKFGIGRFAEARILYSSSVFRNRQYRTAEDRTIHLGIDIFAPAGTPVHAPADATVHLYNYKPGGLDYGHMIILKHQTGTGDEFFTLYGHLAGKSSEGIVEGKKLKKGEVFAWIGDITENGGWSPHLHFQIMTDLLGYGIDFPGVCKPWERNAWFLLSPDPDLFLNIPSVCFPEKEKTADETWRRRKKYFAENLSLSYRKPVKMVRGYMQYMYDWQGQKYLDAYNNVPHIGHCHPEIIEAAYEQMKILNTNTRYLNDHPGEFAQLLLGTFQKPLEVCFFLNSASEANELALRLAFTYTGMKDVIVLEGAYHGNTNTLIDISPYKHDGPGGSGRPPWVHVAPVPDCYRGKYKYDDREAGLKYAGHIEEIVIKLKKKGSKPAAFIAETCPSVGGQLIFPAGYLDEVYRIVRGNGGVCIADEVQTGYGRMGTSFYAFEDQGVRPDIVVLGKPIGNGHPLAAVVTTREIAAAFNTGMEFFSTFGGNTVSAVVGKKTLEIVLRDKYMEHAHETGTCLLGMLRPFMDRYPLVGDVRGSGLFLGIELVRNRDSLEPAGVEASYVRERLKEMKILTGTDGPHNNVLKIRPPMPFDEENADILVDRLSEIFEDELLTG